MVTSATIHCEPGRLTSQDLCNACPAHCELACEPLTTDLCRDLMVRRGWRVELSDAEPDDWALFLGRLLLVDSDLRVELATSGPLPVRHDCDAELKARPDYSVGHGTPEVFACSCGKRYEYCCEESEGAAWELVA